MTFLVDTNVFLEILLRRAKKDNCKRFLDENIGQLNITDFSLHSIGVILFDQKRTLQRIYLTGGRRGAKDPNLKAGDVEFLPDYIRFAPINYICH